jgi:hypothetical protein
MRLGHKQSFHGALASGLLVESYFARLLINTHEFGPAKVKILVMVAQTSRSSESAGRLLTVSFKGGDAEKSDLIVN